LALVDTSAWIEYVRDTGSAVHLRLRELIASDASVALTQPIAMELLTGARDPADELRLRTIIESFDLFPFDPDIDFDQAASIARLCRASGFSVHAVDCMIASVALRFDAAVLAADRDFARIATVVPLLLDEATPR
jgi:predicted nucleic acid-binding protein